MIVGYYINSSENINNNIELIKSLKLKTALQIFVTNPRSGGEINYQTEYNNLNYLVIHGSYIDTPWNLNYKSFYNINKELEIGESINSNGLIIHMSKKTNENINKVLKNLNLRNQILYLEINAAKANKDTFETPEKLNNLFSKINNKDNKIGLCIDTAHLYSLGINFSKYNDVANWFESFYSYDSLKNLNIVIHLNDSKKELGSGKDEHANLFMGNIWKDRYDPDSGLLYLFELCKINKIPIIFERNNIENSILDLNICSNYNKSKNLY